MIKKLKLWWGRYLWNKFSVRGGPQMIKLNDEWIFIDAYRNIYRIRYTGSYDSFPFDIMLIHKG